MGEKVREAGDRVVMCRVPRVACSDEQYLRRCAGHTRDMIVVNLLEWRDVVSEKRGDVVWWYSLLRSLLLLPKPVPSPQPHPT